MKKIMSLLSLLLLALNNSPVAAQAVAQKSESFSVNLHEVNQQSEIGLESASPTQSVQIPTRCCKSMVEFQNALDGAGRYYLFDGYTSKQITSQNLADVMASLKDKAKAVNLTVYHINNT